MPHARATDPSTSHAAAASVTKITGTQGAILRLLFTPRMDEELVDAYYRIADQGIAPYASPSGIRSRRAELVEKGWVEDTGARVKMRSGRMAIVWATTDEGRLRG